MAGLIKRSKLTGILFCGLILYFTNLYFLKCWPTRKGPPQINWNDNEQDEWAIPLKIGLVEASPSQRRKNFKTAEYPLKKTFVSEFATKRTSKIIWKNKKQLKTTISKTGIPLRTRLVKASPSKRRKNFKATEYPPKKTFASEFAIKGISKIIWRSKEYVKTSIPQSGIPLRAGLVKASPSKRRKNFRTTKFPTGKTFASDFAAKGTSRIIWKNKKQVKTAISQSGIPISAGHGRVEASTSERRKNFKTNEYPPKKIFASEFATNETSKVIWKKNKQVKTTQSGVPLRTKLVKASPSERRKNFTTTEYPLTKTFGSKSARKRGTSKMIWKNKKQVKTPIPQSGITLRTVLVEATPSDRRTNFTITEYPPKKTFSSEFGTKETSEIILKNKKQVKTTVSQRGIPLSPSERRKNFTTTEYPPKKTFASEFVTKGTSKIIWKNKKQIKTPIPQSGITLRTGLVQATPSERRKNFTITEYPPKKTFSSEFGTKGASRIILKNKKQVKTTVSQRGIPLSPSERRKNFTTTEYPPKKTFASEFVTKGTSKIIWKNQKQRKTSIPQSGITLRTGLVQTTPSDRRTNFTITEYPPKKTFSSEFGTKGTSTIILKNKKQVKTTVSQRGILLSPSERRKNFTTTEYPPKKTFASEFVTKRTSKIIWKNKKEIKTPIPQSGITLRTGLVQTTPSEGRKNFTITEYPPKKTIASEFATKGTSKIIKYTKQAKTTISQSGIPFKTGLVEASLSEQRKNFMTIGYLPTKTFASEFATKGTSKIIWKNTKQLKTTIPQSDIPLKTGLVEASPSERRKNFTTTEYPPKKTIASEFATKGTSKIIKYTKQAEKTISQSGIPLKTGLVEASPSERRKNFTAIGYLPTKTFASEFATKGTSTIIWKNMKQLKTTISQSGIPLRTGLVEASPSERRKNFTTNEYPPKKTFGSEFATKGTSKIINNKKQVKTTISQSGNHLKIARNITFKSVLQKNETRSCAHRINVMSGGIVLFRNITIRSKLGRARVLETNLEQPAAEDEFFKLEKGFFTLYCVGNVNDAKERIHSAVKYHALRKWVRTFEAANPSISVLLGLKQSFHAGQYLAIERFEYANVYWTIIDLLDIFITTQRLGIEPEKLNIVLMDAHPPSSLDPFWSVLFQKLIKLGTDDIFKQSNNVMFENLVWRYPRVKCPLLDRSPGTPNPIQPFRSFVLERFGIPSGPRLRDCVQKKLNVLVTFRRDYQNHPRNVKGIIDRKIANEKDVVNEMKNGFPNLNITAAQLDSLPLKRQLELVASADIFFGMHGAAHAFPIFMAPGGAVIEMFNFQSNNWHMKRISTLSGHFHITWINRDVKAYNQTTRSTTIPAGIPSRLLRYAIENICAHKFNKKKDKP